MEYLMTYGWAILVVAVVVSLLLALGVFNSPGNVPNICAPSSSFTCADPLYTPSGISAMISQNSGQTYFGAWVFVASDAEEIGGNGLPQNFSTTSTANMLALGAFTPGSFISFTYNDPAGDIPTANVPVGTPFAGYIWLAYCTNPGCSEPTHYSKVGSVSSIESFSTLIAPNYLLTEFASPIGGGSVSPGTGYYTQGANVILQATTANGYSFTDWTCSGRGCYSGSAQNAIISIGSNVTEIAHFQAIVSQFSLNTIASSPLEGTVYPGNLLENAATEVSVSAYSNPGYVFHNWTGSGAGSYTGTDNPGTVTMDGDVQETANFQPVGSKTFLLNMSINPAGAGSISPGNALETANQIYSILATPDTGYQFENWTASGSVGNYIGTNNPASVTMYGNMTETANFALLYVPITLTNNQNLATPSNFQQMLVINSHTYADFIRSKWTNVEFTTGPHTGTVLPAWVEQGASNTSTHTIVWVNMGSDTIGGNSNTVIYMDFMSSNVMSASGPTGEAPELSCTSPSVGCSPYAEYDNGAEVFASYQNFDTSGCGAPSGWYDSGCATGCSYVSFNYGYNLGAVNGCGWVYLGSNMQFTSSSVVDVQLTYIQSNSGGNWQEPFVDSSSSSSWSPQDDAVGWQDNGGCNNVDENALFSVQSSAGGAVIGSDNGVFPQDVVSIANGEVYSNYTADIAGTNILANGGYLALASYTTNYCGASFSGYWARVRAAPPNGVMPGVTVG
jgi:hypothetical protein